MAGISAAFSLSSHSSVVPVGAWLEAKREAQASGRPADEVLRQLIAGREPQDADDISK